MKMSMEKLLWSVQNYAWQSTEEQKNTEIVVRKIKEMYIYIDGDEIEITKEDK